MNLRLSIPIESLAIGGSTTICGYLDQSETWTHLLQEILNRNTKRQQVWVGNGGLSGASTSHHLIALQYLPLRQLKIDTVILLIGINDLSQRLSRDKDYDPHFPEKPEAQNELLAETFRGTFDIYSEDTFYKRTAIWQMLRRAKRLIPRAHIEDGRGRIYVTWREHRQRASEIRENFPDLSSALEEYARNINKIIDIAQEKSVRLILYDPTHNVEAWLASKPGRPVVAWRNRRFPEGEWQTLLFCGSAGKRDEGI